MPLRFHFAAAREENVTYYREPPLLRHADTAIIFFRRRRYASLFMQDAACFAAAAAIITLISRMPPLRARCHDAADVFRCRRYIYCRYAGYMLIRYATPIDATPRLLPYAAAMPAMFLALPPPCHAIRCVTIRRHMLTAYAMPPLIFVFR